MGVHRRLWQYGLPSILLLWVSCVSLPRSFHALEYRNQKVFLGRHHYYQVGPLSKEWVLKKSKQPGIHFHNIRYGATITTEALCGGAYEDLSLDLLTDHLFAGLTEIQKKGSQVVRLDDRQALYTRVTARLDGAPVHLNIVVLKKEQCQFDFYAVTKPSYGEEITKDFKEFVKGFHYQP